MIAALYIDPRGPYPHIPGVECWGLPYRDARRYEGPHPIVAHPPCGAWSSLRHVSKQRFGFPNRSARGSCALRAVDQVREFGGVLEHPAHSTLWSAVAMPRPGQPTDQFGGYTLEVCQCDFGHVARKRTWLYFVGVPSSAIVLPEPREPTHWVSGYRESPTRKTAGGKGPVPPGIKVCSAEQRRRTPRAFAEWLVALAAQVRRSQVA